MRGTWRCGIVPLLQVIPFGEIRKCDQISDGKNGAINSSLGAHFGFTLLSDIALGFKAGNSLSGTSEVSWT